MKRRFPTSRKGDRRSQFQTQRDFQDSPADFQGRLAAARFFFAEPILHQRHQGLSFESGNWRRRDNARMTVWLSRLAGRLLRFVLIVAGLVFALSVLVAGLLLAVVLGVVSLLRGRRPTVGWQTFQQARTRASSHMAGRRGPSAPAGEVIDVEVRELPPRR